MSGERRCIGVEAEPDEDGENRLPYRDAALGGFDPAANNESAILSKQGSNRANYLESQMTQQWADIGALAASINEKTQAAVDAGELSLDRLESSSKEAAKLIGQICTDMIETMYRNKVSGIYVIFSTSNLDGNTESKTGFHVRDFDPKVNATTQYTATFCWNVRRSRSSRR